MRHPPCLLALVPCVVGCGHDLDPCLAEAYPVSASIDPGRTNTGLYETVTPFEHADVERTHVYRADFGGTLTRPLDNRVRVREYDGVHESPYNVVTRDRDELFVYGGTQGERDDAQGPYVVKLDATTREVIWRVDLRDTKARGEFLWPGLVTVHGSGDLYAIYGTRLARLDPRDGSVEREVQLPTPAGTVPEDINYNGFTVLESGAIVTKSFGRPAGCTEQGVDAFQNCVSEDSPLPPSVVVSVDPESLDVLDTYQLEEGAGGRLTRAVFEGREYVYVPGDTTIVRFEVDVAGELSLDEGWRVADYLDEGQTPASAPVAMGDWIVFQTNASLSSAPLSVFAVAQADASTRLETKPFTPGFPPVSAPPRCGGSRRRPRSTNRSSPGEGPERRRGGARNLPGRRAPVLESSRILHARRVSQAPVIRANRRRKENLRNAPTTGVTGPLDLPGLLLAVRLPGPKASSWPSTTERSASARRIQRSRAD